MARKIEELRCDSGEALANLLVRRFETSLIALPKAAFVARSSGRPANAIFVEANEVLVRQGGSEAFVPHRQLLDKFGECVTSQSSSALRTLGKFIKESPDEMREALKWERNATDALFCILGFYKLSERKRARNMGLRRAEPTLLSGVDRNVANEWSQLRALIEDAERLFVRPRFNATAFAKLTRRSLQFLSFFLQPISELANMWSPLSGGIATGIRP